MGQVNDMIPKCVYVCVHACVCWGGEGEQNLDPLWFVML